MAQSWGAASRLLAKDVRKEEREIAEAGRKAGLAGSLGSFLGGLGAMALTGGTVNPITIGLIKGGATAGGGFLGKQIFTGRKTKETLAGKRGKFLMGDRAELSDMLTSDIFKSALSAGTTAAMTQYGTNIKEGLTGMGKEIVKPEVIGASAEELLKTKDNIQSMMDLRGKSPLTADVAKSPTFPTPDVPDIDSSPIGTSAFDYKTHQQDTRGLW